MVSILDIIGPVMVGPSSSHTAGACRLGLLARALAGGTPQRARIDLHGSFARTGEGHGTDRAIAAGLMGFRPEDLRIRAALEIAAREQLAYVFRKVSLREDAHPNTTRIALERDAQAYTLTGESLGAGRVRVTEIDGFPVEVHGDHPTLIVLAADVKGSVARIAGLLSEGGINIATLRLTRKRKGGEQFMVIEIDEPPAESVRADIAALSWVRRVHCLERIGA